MNKRRKLLMGIGTGTAMAAWQKPIINSVVVPAHAQTSPTTTPEPTTLPPTTVPPTTTPAPVCPDIVIGNALGNALSGANSTTSCGVTFDILSSDPMTTLTITSIETDALADGVSVTNDGLGMATSMSGPRVTWQGPINGTAPSDCLTNVVPSQDVTFTIMATCDTSALTLTQTFTLSEIVASL